MSYVNHQTVFSVIRLSRSPHCCRDTLSCCNDHLALEPSWEFPTLCNGLSGKPIPTILLPSMYVESSIKALPIVLGTRNRLFSNSALSHSKDYGLLSFSQLHDRFFQALEELTFRSLL